MIKQPIDLTTSFVAPSTATCLARDALKIAFVQTRRQTRLVGSIATRSIGSLLQLVVLAVITRSSGVETAGLFYLFMSWMTFLSTFGSLGLPVQTMRAVASLDALGRIEDANARIRQNFVAAIGYSVCLAAVIALAAPYLSRWLALNVRGYPILILASISAVAFTATRITSETLKARNRANEGMCLDSVLPFAGLLLCMGMATALSLRLSPAMVVNSYAVTLTFIGIVAAVRLWRLSPSPATNTNSIALDRDTLPLWGIALVNNAITLLPYLVLPHFATLSQIGCFAIGHRLIGFCATLTVALGSHFGPGFARNYSLRKVDELSRQFRSSQVWSFLAYLPFLLLYTVFAKFILVIFGRHIATGDTITVLAILAIGRAVNAACGLTEYFLSMVNRSGVEFWSSVSSLVIFLGFTALLGKAWGVVGVAFAFSLSMAVRAAASLVYVRFSTNQLQAATSF